MTLRKKTKYSTNVGTQRVSLVNGNIPGRMAKPYHVSYYAFRETPGRIMYRNRATGWEPVLADRIMAGRDISRFPESEDFLYEPFGHPLSDTVTDDVAAKLRAQTQKARDFGLNVGVFVAELPSTMNMFANTATRIVTAWRNLRRGDLSAAARGLGLNVTKKQLQASPKQVQKTWGNHWLELKYGWLPLLSDVDAAAHKLAHELHRPPKFSVRARSGRETEHVTAISSRGTLTTTHSVSLEQGFTFTVSSGMIAHAASLGLTNPMLIAWETVPLSFVFDWLIPIGQYLQGFSAYHGLAFVGGWSSRRGRKLSVYSYPEGSSQGYYVQSYYADGHSPPELHRYQPDWDENFTAGSIVVDESGFHRQTLSDFPGRGGLKLDFGPSLPKLITSLALIRQRM